MLPGKIYNLKSTFFYFSLSILSAWNCKLPKLPQTQKSKLCFHHNTRAWGFSRFSKAQQNQNEKSFYKCLETFIQSMNPNLSGFGAEAALRAVQIADNVSLTMGLILKKKKKTSSRTQLSVEHWACKVRKFRFKQRQPRGSLNRQLPIFRLFFFLTSYLYQASFRRVQRTRKYLKG